MTMLACTAWERWEWEKVFIQFNTAHAEWLGHVLMLIDCHRNLCNYSSGPLPFNFFKAKVKMVSRTGITLTLYCTVGAAV